VSYINSCIICSFKISNFRFLFSIKTNHKTFNRYSFNFCASFDSLHSNEVDINSKVYSSKFIIKFSSKLQFSYFRLMYNFQISLQPRFLCWIKTTELVAWKIIVPKSTKHNNHNVLFIYFHNQLKGTQNVSFVIIYWDNVSDINLYQPRSFPGSLHNRTNEL